MFNYDGVSYTLAPQLVSILQFQENYTTLDKIIRWVINLRFGFLLLCYSTWPLSTLPPDRNITTDWRRKRKHKVQNKENTKKYIDPTKFLPCYQHRCFLDSSSSKYRAWERLHIQSIGDLNLLNELVIRSLIPKGKVKKLPEIDGCFFFTRLGA